MPAHRLITVCFSHFVERARWGLDRVGLPYVEAGHMPVFHMPFVWHAHRGRAGRKDAASSPLSTPVLVLPSGECICDSRAILDHLDAEHSAPDERLYPREHPEAERLEALEARWHDDLAIHSRRLAYGACFASPGVLEAIARHNVGRVEAGAFRVMLPLVERFMRGHFDINEAGLEESRSVCWRELDSAAEHLADGRPYLAGERFSGWDLSFACFAAPLVLPAEYAAWLPALRDLDPEDAAYIREVRQHPAAIHALRMFAEHRPPRA